MYAAGLPQSVNACDKRYALVVLPFVPVIPAMVSACEGAPKKAIRDRPDLTTQLGHARDKNLRCPLPALPRETGEGLGGGTFVSFEQYRPRAALHGLLRKFEPMMRTPATCQKQRSRACRTAVERHVRDENPRRQRGESGGELGERATDHRSITCGPLPRACIG